MKNDFFDKDLENLFKELEEFLETENVEFLEKEFGVDEDPETALPPHLRTTLEEPLGDIPPDQRLGWEAEDPVPDEDENLFQTTPPPPPPGEYRPRDDWIRRWALPGEQADGNRVKIHPDYMCCGQPPPPVSGVGSCACYPEETAATPIAPPSPIAAPSAPQYRTPLRIRIRKTTAILAWILVVLVFFWMFDGDEGRTGRRDPSPTPIAAAPAETVVETIDGDPPKKGEFRVDCFRPRSAEERAWCDSQGMSPAF